MFASYTRLLRFVRPYWLRLGIAGVLLVLSSLATLALPWVVGNVVDSALVQQNFRLLNWVTALLFVLFALQAILGFGQSYLLGWTGERVVANLREQLYGHLQGMPLGFFANTRVGELLSRLGNDVTTIQNAVTDTLLSLLSNTVMLIGGIVIIFAMAWRLTFVILAVVPLAVIGIIVLGRFVRKLSRQVQDALADSSAMAEEALVGVRIVKSFAREPYEVDRYNRAVEKLFGISITRVRLAAILGPTIGFIAYAAIALVLWFGSREVIAGRLTPGELISFLLYTIMIASPMASFTGIYTQFQRAIGASERVFELLDAPPEMHDDPGALELPPITGEVRFEGVTFDYADATEPREVLREVDLQVPAGQVIALVGPSGAGKTTLVHLVPRFYDVTQGRITVDGYDIREVKIRSLREQIGIVPQETALFGGTVGDNIRYGKLDATQAEIEEAARAANAHDFILALPKGYDTVVGERGVKLSGGQRQRVAIARALLKDPRILILDEATSSLDSESELAVQEALERLMNGRTTFVIAHRLSTITGADWIVVLDDGRIIEQGRHESLVAQEGGLYRRMYALQFQLDLVDES
jgi:ATP-binding cassette, subfamily B, bacterial MsbA